jgi:hypothetical protein
MSKTTAGVLIVLIGGIVGVLLLERRQGAVVAGVRADAGVTVTIPISDAGADSAGPLDAGEDAEADIAEAVNSDAGATLLDGGKVPALPNDLPKSVNFGAILVQYASAQGAKRDARDRPEALKLAGELATLAKTDFAGAVAKGDPGSTTNAGPMPRGVLEPAAEYSLFSLQPGEVSEPVDTPRGYLIVKRLE